MQFYTSKDEQCENQQIERVYRVNMIKHGDASLKLGEVWDRNCRDFWKERGDGEQRANEYGQTLW